MQDSLQTSSKDSQQGIDQALSLLDPRIQEWLRTKGSPNLSAPQEERIRAILDAPDEPPILTDSALGGAIDAVYMAVLTQLATPLRDVAGFLVLHVSPHRTSVDAHYERIGEMARLVDIPATRWHDEVPCADKARALESPTGILLTTLEALEAFVTIRASQLPMLFGSLEYLIVEQSGTVTQRERGSLLQTVLSRIGFPAETSPRCIVLGTTSIDSEVRERHSVCGEGDNAMNEHAQIGPRR
ncbi:hypothetical protein ACFLSZ_03690 [Candidatus Bipolaricaulota bacterium]